MNADYVGDQPVPMIAVSGSHDAVPDTGRLPLNPRKVQGSSAILTPNTSPSVSRRSSLESNMTGYSHNITPPGLATNEPIKTVQPSQTPSMTDYYDPQLAHPSSGQGSQHGLWGPLPHTHQPLGFQGF